MKQNKKVSLPKKTRFILVSILIVLLTFGVVADRVRVDNFNHGGSPNNIKTNKNTTSTIPFKANGSVRELVIKNNTATEFFVPTGNLADMRSFVKFGQQKLADNTFSTFCIDGTIGLDFEANAGAVGPCQIITCADASGGFDYCLTNDPATTLNLTR